MITSDHNLREPKKPLGLYPQRNQHFLMGFPKTRIRLTIR